MLFLKGFIYNFALIQYLAISCDYILLFIYDSFQFTQTGVTQIITIAHFLVIFNYFIYKLKKYIFYK